jgi:hypothetical protein
MQAA